MTLILSELCNALRDAISREGYHSDIIVSASDFETIRYYFSERRIGRNKHGEFLWFDYTRIRPKQHHTVQNKTVDLSDIGILDQV